MATKTVIGSIALGALAVVGANAFYTVNETEQAMVLQLGQVKNVIKTPGLKFKTPFIQNVIYFDKRVLETDSQPEEIQSKDKEPMLVDSFSRWRIIDVSKFYKTVTTETEARRRLDIIVNSALRRKLAQHSSTEVVSGDRAQIMDDILQEAKEQAKPLGIDVVDVRIKRADWPAKISRAVYERMNEERHKEAKEIRAKGAEVSKEIKATAEKERTILLAEAQRDAQKLRGEGDAESIRITASAFGRDSHFYGFLRSLDAYKNALKGKDTMMILDPDVKFLEHFNR